MRGVTSTRVPEGLDIGQPTLENLLTHVRKFGLDRNTSGYHQGKEKEYSTYKQFSSDSAAEVAFASLSEDAYARFVRTVGETSWEGEARDDYRQERG